MDEERETTRNADARFAARVAAHYAPAALTPSQRARFDTELRGRIGAGRRRALWVPALGAVAAAALVAALLVRGPAREATDAVPVAARAVPAATGGSRSAAADWEVRLLDPAAAADSEVGSREADLPDDYVAIAGAFLDS